MSLPLLTSNPVPLKCGGVLPFTFDEHNQLLIMLGQEDKSPTWVDSEKWSDFTGAPKPDELHEETAANEWWEETMGIFGCKATYLAIVRERGIKVMPAPNVVIYLVRMPYEPTILTAYNNMYAHLSKCKMPHPVWPGAFHFPSCPEGFAEKTALKWYLYNHVIVETSSIYRTDFLTSLKSESMNTALKNLKKSEAIKSEEVKHIPYNFY